MEHGASSHAVGCMHRKGGGKRGEGGLVACKLNKKDARSVYVGCRRTWETRNLRRAKKKRGERKKGQKKKSQGGLKGARDVGGAMKDLLKGPYGGKSFPIHKEKKLHSHLERKRKGYRDKGGEGKDGIPKKTPQGGHRC